MTRCKAGALGCLLGLMVGCSVPHSKDFDDPPKQSVSRLQAFNVVSDFNADMELTIADGGFRMLRRIETGSLYDIDAVALFSDQQLGLPPSTTRIDDVAMFAAASFAAYPLEFVAVSDTSSAQQVAGLFVKPSSTSEWRLELAPRLNSDTAFPAVQRGEDGAAVSANPDDSVMSTPSPQTVVLRYTRVLADPASSYAAEFEGDPFLTSIRALEPAQPPERATLARTWSAEPVTYALRLADGGAISFATVQRTDVYRVTGHRALSWADSEAAAYLPRPVRSEATLSYAHQLLMWQPAQGKPAVIGEYGGLVAATGH